MRRRPVTRVLLWFLVVSVAFALFYGGYLFWQSRALEKSPGSTADREDNGTPGYTVHEIARGTIQNTVTGTGMLSFNRAFPFALPFPIKVTETLVRQGQAVARGDALVAVDSADLMETLVALEEALSDAESELSQQSKAYESEAGIPAGFAGRIKAIHAQVGSLVQDYVDDGQSLAILSLDGRMVVRIPGEGLAVGQTLTVAEGRSRFAATVDRLEGALAAITFSDSRVLPGTRVSVYRDRDEIGSGDAEVNLPYEIRPQVQGYILRIPVSLNQQVSAKTVLFRISQIALSQGYVFQQRRVESATQHLKQAQEIFRSGTVTAPEDGVVDNLIEASPAQVDADTVLFTLLTGGAGSMDISIDELDIDSVASGQAATVTIDALRGLTLPARVEMVSHIGTYSSGVTTFDVLLLLGGDERLKSGMNGTAIISVNKAEDVLLLPLSALQDRGGRQYVWLLDASMEERGSLPDVLTEVSTGLSDASYAEVTDGLREGDVVLIPGNALLGADTGQRSREGITFDPSRMGMPPNNRQNRFPGN